MIPSMEMNRNDVRSVRRRNWMSLGVSLVHSSELCNGDSMEKQVDRSFGLWHHTK